MGGISKFVDAMSGAGAPWWAIAWIVIAVLIFTRGPALIKALSDAALAHRKHNLKRETLVGKVRNNAAEQQARKQLPAPPSRSKRSGTK